MPKYLPYLLITLIGGVLFMPLLGGVHLFDWDEINFAECAREMIVSKDYLRAQIDFSPFWEKPPVFIWMQVLAMKLFGVNEYAARFPNAVMGIATLCTIFYVGKRVVNEHMASLWVLLYVITWLPHFYFKTGIIDPTFNFFIFLSFFQVYLLGHSEQAMKHALLGGLFLGLAILTKGPAAALVVILSFSVFFLLQRGFKAYKIKYLTILAIVATLPMLLWLGAAVMSHGMAWGHWFITEFVTYQIRLFRTEDADHGGPFYYHFVILLIGCFPASGLLFQYIKGKKGLSENAAFTRWMWVMFWVVLILFSIVKTKIVHYSSLCYFPLTYLAALQLYRLQIGEERLKRLTKVVLICSGGVIALLLIALPIVGINKADIVKFIDDPFAVGNLQATIHWSYFECTIGVLALVGTIAGVILMGRNFKKGLVLMAGLQILLIQATIIDFTPNIEGYSQRAAIDFYKSMQGKDVYIHTIGFKSYAYLFYSQKQPSKDSAYYQPEVEKELWLINGPVDKPTYFVSKIQLEGMLLKNSSISLIYEKNGFAFFERKR